MIKDFKDYSDFCQYYDENDELFEVILDYDDFLVVLDYETGCYYFLENGENDASEFYEVELCATLRYDVDHDLTLEPDDTGNVMSALFECDCCGERVEDDYIEYLWFKRVE